MTGALYFNESDVRKLWNLLGFGEGRLAEMRCINMDPDAKGDRCLSRTFTTELSQFIDWARSWNGKGNCFVGRNARRPDDSKKMIDVSAITLDLDPIGYDKATGATLAQTEECINAAKIILSRFRGGSVCITGNGALLVWTSQHPACADRGFEEKLKCFQDECSQIIGQHKGVRIDATQDSARLIKLIGTVSVKGRITPTRFLHLASGRGAGEDVFRHIEQLGSSTPPSQGVLLAKSNYPSRSEADYTLALYYHKAGLSPYDILEALAKNILGRNDRVDDHIRIVEKVCGLRYDRASKTFSTVTPQPHVDIIMHDPRSSMHLYKEELQRRKKYVEPELPTGFIELDKATHGLQRKEIYTVAARTRIGKSCFLANVASALCARGKRVALLSTELDFLRVWDRVFASNTGVPGTKFVSATFSPDEEKSIEAFWQRYDSWQLKICDSFKPNLNTVTKVVEQFNPDVLMFDHIQHIDGGEMKHISDFTRGLKELAMKHNCAVMVASQVRRLQSAINFKTGKREFAIPTLSDLKGCGTIEEESSFVLVLHRPEVEDIEDDPAVTSVELLKNRYGAMLSTQMFFYRSIQKFKSLSEVETTCS